jgi:hypothetical protein
MNKSNRFVKNRNTFQGKKPLLIQEEDRGGQGLKGIMNLHNHYLRPLV